MTRWNLVRCLKRPVHAHPAATRLLYRARYGRFGVYLADAVSIPGWLGRQEGLALANACHALAENAVIVEIGSFLGKSAVVLAGACELRDSGRVHCIDPFDASGDAFSRAAYSAVADADRRSLRQRFDANIARAGLSRRVEVHAGTAASVAAGWTASIDLLFLDGDQSPEGATLAYNLWSPFLKIGGVIALHNSNERTYAPDHDGHYLIAVHRVRPPEYGEVRCVDTTTFARRLS